MPALTPRNSPQLGKNCLRTPAGEMHKLRSCPGYDPSRPKQTAGSGSLQQRQQFPGFHPGAVPHYPHIVRGNVVDDDQAATG